jgi:predicted dienelactone hydrolase
MSLVAALVALAVFAASSRAAPSTGLFPVATRALTFEEPAPRALANATTSSGAPVRRLPTELWYPRGKGPFPLIVFSPGFLTAPRIYAALIRSWAQAGYVVAAPTYPWIGAHTPDGLDDSDVVHDPDDLKFVISRLLAEAAPGGPLAKLVRPRKLAIVGQSDGAAVSLAVAAGSCCRDRAVKAAVILSGAELSSFHSSYYTAGSVPLLVTQGNRDPINLPGCSVALYNQAPAPKYYVDLLGAAHLRPYVDRGPARRYVSKAVLAFLSDYLNRKTAALAGLLRGGGVPRVATITSTARLLGQGSYCP